MVRNYKRISVRKSWSQEALTAAIEAVQAGSTVNRAALSHGVPRPTLRKYLLLVGPPDENRNLSRFKLVFTAQQERELVDYILAMEVTPTGSRHWKCAVWPTSWPPSTESTTPSTTARSWLARIGCTDSACATRNFRCEHRKQPLQPWTNFTTL